MAGMTLEQLVEILKVWGHVDGSASLVSMLEEKATIRQYLEDSLSYYKTILVDAEKSMEEVSKQEHSEAGAYSRLAGLWSDYIAMCKLKIAFIEAYLLRLDQKKAEEPIPDKSGLDRLEFGTETKEGIYVEVDRADKRAILWQKGHILCTFNIAGTIEGKVE